MFRTLLIPLLPALASAPLAQEVIRTDVTPATPAEAGIRVVQELPESWTPHTLLTGTEGRGPEDESAWPKEPAENLTAPGDSSSTRTEEEELPLDRYALAFVGGEYVPPAGERIDPALHRTLGSTRLDVGYGFVMFEGPITSWKRKAVEDLGVELGDHHTFNCMTAVIPAGALAPLAKSPAVRWVGQARPFQKIGPVVSALLAERFVDPAALDRSQRFLIKVHASDMTPGAQYVPITDAGGTDRATALTDYAVIPNGPFQAALEADGAKVHAYHEDLRVFVVEAELGAAERFAERDFVHYVEHDARIEPAHDRSTRQIGVDYIRSIAGNDGSDTVVGMMDSGMDITHVDTQVKWYAGWNYDGQSVYTDSTGHGTHVMGTIMSPGNGDDRFRGCAPGVGVTSNRRIYVASIFGGPSANSSSSNAIAAFSRFAMPVTINSITTPIPSVVNHSWGVGTSGMPAGGWVGTDTLSLALDFRVFNDRQTHVVAAHNQGGASYASQNLENVLRPAVAKLSLTVANCLSAPEDGSLPGRPHFSSNKGPTGDDRYCPHIMAPGRGIGSVQAGTNSGYVSFNGTSMATPHVVGTIAGLHEHYSWMKTSPAATRAVIAATSNPYAGVRTSSNTSSDSYINRQGFGQVDAYKAHYQRDEPDGFMVGRYYGTFTSATNGWSFDVAVPADAAKTNWFLCVDEEPASQGAVRSCIHDFDLYIDVAPFTAGYDTGEYSATRTWDTWEYYQNVASIANLRGKNVRIKIYPRVRPTGNDVVRFGVAYMIPRGDVTPSGSIVTQASETYVQPGEQIGVTATMSVPTFLQTNSYVDLNGLDGFTIDQLTFRDREDLLRTFGNVDNWTLGLQGYWFSATHRRLEWLLTAPNSNGWKTITARLQADNRSGSTTDSDQVCVDGQSPSQVQGLTSTSHTPNVWSNDVTVDLVWNQVTDNGCSGIDGLASKWNLGGTSVPQTINLAANATSLGNVARPTSADTQFFTLSGVDRAGNKALHAFAGPFLIDGIDPTLSSVVIDNGALFTEDLTVDVQISAADAHSGVDEMRWSGDGLIWSPWTAYSSSFQTTVNSYGGGSDEGSKRIYVQVRDTAGNVSTTRSDTITYLRCPNLRQVVGPTTLENVSDGAFHIQGTDLGDVLSVHFGPFVITSQSPLDQADGYLQIIDDDNVLVHPPLGLPPGSYAIAFQNRVCESNRLTVDLVCNAALTLRIADQVDSSQAFSAFVARGNLSPSAICGLVLSGSNVPSVLPGIVSLGVGNNWQNILILPLSQNFDPVTCTSRWDFANANAFQGQTIHFQAIVQDLNLPNPLPIPTSNVESVDLF